MEEAIRVRVPHFKEQAESPIGQGYGLTETCAGGTFCDFDDTSVGRVGPPLPCSFVKLVDWPEGGYLVNDSPMPRGVIVISGPATSKTKEVYKDDARGMRWFYAGDIGQFHADDGLEIIDRKKDIGKLQYGEYISLGKALEDWASKQGISYEGFAELCVREDSVKEVHHSLMQAAKAARLERFEIPAKIKLLPDAWTPETGLVTAALKLKKDAIKKSFSDQLNQLYS